MKCPFCGGAFIAPGVNGPQVNVEPGGIDLTLPAIIVSVIAGHVLIALISSIVWSPGVAFALVIIGWLLGLAYWQRDRLLGLGQHIRESETTRQLARDVGEQRGDATGRSDDFLPGNDSTFSAVSSSDNIVAAEAVSEYDDEFVEIQAATVPTSPPKTISVQNRNWTRPSMSSHLGGQPLKADLPKDTVYFYGPGTQLDLGRAVLEWPLVYATGAAYQGTFDASLIDGSLPVAPPKSQVNEQLPYWPSYYDCSPAQRSRYVDWLLDGRSDPSVELGFVFIFFYGLERRIIIDQADHIPIAYELVRLLPIYGRSNSFRNYASNLLWLTLYLASHRGDVPTPLFAKARDITPRWHGDTLAYCLAIYAQRNTPLPADIAYLVAKADPHSKSSVIVRRHGAKFQELFKKKYEAQFSTGILLRTPEQPRPIDYYPASASLHDGACHSSLQAMPDVFNILCQFKPLVEIWEECIDELKAFNRAHRSSKGLLSDEAYEALPEELREDDHPAFDKWLDLWEKHADDDGWPLVPVGELAALKGIDRRNRLTKSECHRILKTADAMGIGVEPDARITHQKYRWNERVSFFFLESDDAEDMTVYNAAAVLLRLGVSIAEADGTVDEVELNHITNHLEGQFNLSDGQSKRLEQLKYLLLHCKEAENSISSFLRERLSRGNRSRVALFLVGIAAADEVITAKEIKALKQAYRSLQVDESELDKLLVEHQSLDSRGTSAPVAERELHFDMDSISQIMAESRKVAEVLKEAMSVDEREGDTTSIDAMDAATAATDAPFTANLIQPSHGVGGHVLQARFEPFVQAVSRKGEWKKADIEALARRHDVMLNDAIEVINHWSLEAYGDLLINEGEIYTIHTDLLGENQ